MENSNASYHGCRRACGGVVRFAGLGPARSSQFLPEDRLGAGMRLRLVCAMRSGQARQRRFVRAEQPDAESLTERRGSRSPPRFLAKMFPWSALSDADRFLFVIIGVLGALRPAGMAAPRDVARDHVGTITHAEQQRALRAILVFVHFAGWMDHEGTGHDRDGLSRRAHGAAAFEAEIDLGGVRVAMIGADLAGLPAGHGDVAVLNGAEDFFDVLFRIELGLAGDAENLHGRSPWVTRRLLFRTALLAKTGCACDGLFMPRL